MTTDSKGRWLSEIKELNDVISDLEDSNEEDDLFGYYDNYDDFQSEINKQRRENQKLQQEADEHELRINTFNKLFWLMVAFIFVALGIVVCSGLLPLLDTKGQLVGYQFYLSDEVLMTLLGTTMFNVIGVFAIAAKWLFPKKD